jgi:hypothetical protein
VIISGIRNDSKFLFALSTLDVLLFSLTESGGASSVVVRFKVTRAATSSRLPTEPSESLSALS